MGVLCTFVGAFILGAACNRLPFEVPPPNVERWVMAMFSIVFVLPGVWLLVVGTVGILRRRRLVEGALRDPHAAWRWDRKWDRTGIHDDGLRRLAQGWAGLAGITVFLAPFNVFVFVETDSWFARGIIGLFDLFVVAGVAIMIHRLLGELRFGRTRLQFSTFPYRLGQRLAGSLFAPRVPAQVRRLSYTLVCIEERVETTETSDGSRTAVAAFEHFREERQLDPSSAAALAGGGLGVDFELPAVPELATALADDHKTLYWLLELKAELSGVDLHKRYLLPVY